MSWDDCRALNRSRIRWVWLVLLCVVYIGSLMYLVSGQDPEPILQVDTVYAPPPGFSEAFRLDCRWIGPEGEGP